MKAWEQDELPWPQVFRVKCRKCNGSGLVSARPKFRTHGNFEVIGRDTNCPECLGVGSILAPQPD